MMTTVADDDVRDEGAEKEIRECLNPEAPRSFFLYAGAGSGKTRSLVNALRYLIATHGRTLSLRNRRIAVITYTNAACDEIRQRLQFDPLIEVRTIHSFCWSLIDGYNADIRAWLTTRLDTEIRELEQAQAKGRRNTQAFADREKSIESKIKRRASLSSIRRFTYSPNGDNRTRDALNHSEVIAMTADLLVGKPTLQRLFTARYPVLLIDESQDTNRHLMDAVLSVQEKHQRTLCVGLFGDTMQRIYADGKVGLAEAIPTSWARPKKIMNHRCPERIVRLINKVRSEDDGQEQQHRSDKLGGHARLFVLSESTADKFAAEQRIAARMADLTGDRAWAAGDDKVKTLTLEHHMAAQRLGFADLFEALYPVEHMRTGLLDGTAPGVAFFTHDVLPVVNAIAAGDHFRTTALLRERSPLLDRARLKEAGSKQMELVSQLRKAVRSLEILVRQSNSLPLRDLLANIAASALLELPDVLVPFASAVSEAPRDVVEVAKAVGVEDKGDELAAWRRALEAPLSQIEMYDRYVRGESKFDTHQGVKGREFPRVMVVISDEEARGFMFSYEKLVGVKQKTKTDIENEATGRDTSIDRTRRLFYVTCSRAEESLAIVYYSSQPESVSRDLARRGWFDAEEIELVA